MSDDGCGGIAVYSAILSLGPQPRARDLGKGLPAQAQPRSPPIEVPMAGLTLRQAPFQQLWEPGPVLGPGGGGSSESCEVTVLGEFHFCLRGS